MGEQHEREQAGALGVVRLKADDQRQPLALVLDLPQVGHVGDAGLAGEVRDLPGRDAVQPFPGRPERVDVCQQVEPEPELAERRRLRHVFQPVEPAATRDGVHHVQLAQPQPRHGTDPPGNRLVEGGVHLGPDRGGHRVQRGVPGQLAPRPHQLLQRDVDQVGRVVLGLRRLPDGLLGNLPHTGRIVGDLHPGPDELPVPLPGPLYRRPELHLRAQPQAAVHVPDHHRRHVIQLGEIAQPLVRLQQHRERQQVLRVLGPAARPLRFLVRRGKGVSQFPPWHHPAKPRVRGPIDRGHA